MKEIEVVIDRQISANAEFSGTILVRYAGNYDSVVLNVQILDSNELMLFTSLNGKKISSRSSRLFISRDSMPDGTAGFSGIITFEPLKKYDVKFRASIIEQHKEIESDIVFCSLS